MHPRRLQREGELPQLAQRVGRLARLVFIDTNSPAGGLARGGLDEAEGGVRTRNHRGEGGKGETQVEGAKRAIPRLMEIWAGEILEKGDR